MGACMPPKDDKNQVENVLIGRLFSGKKSNSNRYGLLHWCQIWYITVEMVKIQTGNR